MVVSDCLAGVRGGGQRELPEPWGGLWRRSSDTYPCMLRGRQTTALHPQASPVGWSQSGELGEPLSGMYAHKCRVARGGRVYLWVRAISSLFLLLSPPSLSFSLARSTRDYDFYGNEHGYHYGELNGHARRLEHHGLSSRARSRERRELPSRSETAAAFCS